LLAAFAANLPPAVTFVLSRPDPCFACICREFAGGTLPFLAPSAPVLLLLQGNLQQNDRPSV
jgi:hypothetical protein